MSLAEECKSLTSSPTACHISRLWWLDEAKISEIPDDKKVIAK